MTDISEKDIRVVLKWLDGGCSSWGVPADQIHKLCLAHTALEAHLAEAREALEWHPIETAPLNTIVDLWCTYADAPASWGNDRPAGQIVHNRHKSKEYGWFGNYSNDGIPQANGPDLVPVAWRWPTPKIPLEMMERFVAARALGGKKDD